MQHFKTTFLSLFVLLIFCGTNLLAQTGQTTAYTAQQSVAGVKQPVLSLDGIWQFQFAPKGKWYNVQVPGELVMQGFGIEHDKSYLYRKTFTVPADYKNQRTILRFDGVYSFARVSINGKFVREHHGGFTRWETDVTKFVKPGAKNTIEVEITDRKDDISYASGYAHHPIGGILRSVSLLAQPEPHLTDFFAETHLDSLYNDAVLKIGYTPVTASGASVKIALTDPQGKAVTIAQSAFAINGGNAQLAEIAVRRPMKWDAEHPNLYTLNVSVEKDGKTLSRFSKQIGFRDIKIIKDQMFVNGNQVKLRGACRHDIHPELGRTTTPELDSLDVILFKQTNMNFVRTSHYPPSEKFLEYCDRYGVYVECETAVCFVDTYRQKNYAPGATQNETSFNERYLSQVREMVKSFRSHASVLFWSIGNESKYGTNFQDSWDWIKANDKMRPVIFSYPGTTPKDNKIFDILSMHYQDVNGNVNQFGMSTRGYQGEGIPALFDEWAHPACYTYKTLQDDPNIREFWGKSIDMMWSGVFNARGGLGGAIWGYVDETFMVPALKEGKPFWKEFARTAKPLDYQGDCVGYGEWGIVDVWRRPKPEFWATKKAHSPVKLLATEIPSFISGHTIIIPIHNRFDHTDLNEINITYTYNNQEKKMAAPTVKPHAKGLLTIPVENWKNGDQFQVKFSDAKGELIDTELITLGEKKVEFPALRNASTLDVVETADFVTVKGNGFEIPFNKSTGLIQNAVSNGKVIIEKGPFLYLDINLNHLSGAEVRASADKFMNNESDWVKQSFAHEKLADRVNISLNGSYKNVKVEMLLSVLSDGRLEISYMSNGEPNGYLRETGLAFHLPKTIDHLKWQRKGYWSVYPEGDFAGNSGEVGLYDSRQVAYGKKPVQDWQSDTRNYFYWADAGANVKQPLTQTAKGMKENIYSYTLSAGKNNPGFSIISADASMAARVNKRADEQLILNVNNRWDYPEIAWGNYCKLLEASPCYGKVSIWFGKE